MFMEEDMKRFFELDELARREGARYVQRRAAYDDIVRARGRAFIGIVGPRGVGKTVLLRQFALNEERSFYLSLDALGDADLFETAKTLAGRYGIKLILLDEVHFLKGYEAALKKIFDFLSLRVIFTSSVALSLYESAHDLSRRVRLRHLYPFSFGEYLRFRDSAALAPLTLEDIAQRRWTTEHERWGHRFEDYLRGGLFPFALEEPDAKAGLAGILEKVVTRDAPAAGNLRVEEIESLRKLLKFVGSSASEGISFSSISRNVGVTKFKAEQYVRLLQKAFVLNPIFPAGTNVLKEPKVLLWVPLRLLYRGYEEAKGGLREDFAAQALLMRSGSIRYLKSTRGEKTPDFLVEEQGKEIVAEVGGKGKGRRQFKGLSAGEKLIFTDGGEADGMRRPLFLLGYGAW